MSSCLHLSHFGFARARLALVVALASGLTGFGTGVRAQEAISLKDTVPSITTTGEASVEVVPDIATISLGVETERPTAAAAANENARAAQAVIAGMKAQGIDGRDIKTLGVTITPVYDEATDANGRVTKRTLRGYQAQNDLSVRVRQIEAAGALARQWIEKGANNFGGVEFDYDQKEAKYDALRGEAVRDALRKANSYANGLGIRLGRVLEIGSPGQGPGPRPMVMARAAKNDGAAAIPIEPGVQTLRVEVQVSWELTQ
jgi:uncharacterized protein YggE